MLGWRLLSRGCPEHLASGRLLSTTIQPGWILDALGAWIEFNVSFGVQPRLTLGFLQSYTTLGAARLSFVSRPCLYLDIYGVYLEAEPQFTARVSQTTYFFIKVDDAPNETGDLDNISKNTACRHILALESSLF